MRAGSQLRGTSVKECSEACVSRGAALLMPDGREATTREDPLLDDNRDHS